MQIKFGATMFFCKLDACTVFLLFENGQHQSRLNGSAGTSLRAAAHYTIPTVDTPDQQRYATLLPPCCCDASITAPVMIDVTGGVGCVWCVLTFPLLKLQPLRCVGVGLAGKGRMVGSGTKLSFGAIRSQWWCVAQQVGKRGWTE
eukprot:scaffold83197_cov63-Attheya_sp.AAC.1